MTKPIPKPRARTACDQLDSTGKRCESDDTAVVPAFGEADDNGRKRKQWRLCEGHRAEHVADCAGGERMLWALRQVVRQELERAK